MGKPSAKTPKILAALAKGTPVSTIAATYGVSTAYVYALRKRANAPVKAPRAPRARKAARGTMHKPAPVAPQPAPQLSPLSINLTFWQRVKEIFGGAR